MRHSDADYPRSSSAAASSISHLAASPPQRRRAFLSYCTFAVQRALFSFYTDQKKMFATRRLQVCHAIIGLSVYEGRFRTKRRGESTDTVKRSTQRRDSRKKGFSPPAHVDTARTPPSAHMVRRVRDCRCSARFAGLHTFHQARCSNCHYSR